MSARNILLVEGESDRGFFEIFCKNLSLTVMVTVAAPKDLSGRFNSKEGVINFLPELLSQLGDGQLERLAVILDADATAECQGFQNTRDRVSEVVSRFGYQPAADNAAGLVYAHQDGLADLGLWVMPDNANDGMLEDWLKPVLRPEEAPLLGHANHAIDTLPDGTRFKPLHRSKAEIATWMAWQQKPGHGLYRAVTSVRLSEWRKFY